MKSMLPILQYPTGSFSEVAKARLADLETAPELPAEEALKVELLFLRGRASSLKRRLSQ